MTFTETAVAGVYLIDLEPFHDDRGFFARVWSPDDMAAKGLNPALAQVSLSYNAKAGTLRGMHHQAPPHAEVKLVRATAGAIYDVALDLRPESPTYLKWAAAELSVANRRMLYIPEGCAHGFQTLADHTDVTYHVTAAYAPAAARGVRWDDPAFGIRWPRPVTCIAPRDAEYPLWGRAAA